jgi:hypothetical protein
VALVGHDQVVISAQQKPASSRAIAVAITDLTFLRAAGPGELAQLLEIRGCRLAVEHALVVPTTGPDPLTIGTDASTLRAPTVIAAEQFAEPILETHWSSS